MMPMFKNYRALSLCLAALSVCFGVFILFQWSWLWHSPPPLSVNMPLDEQAMSPVLVVPNKSEFDNVVLDSLFVVSRRGELRAPVGRLSNAQGNVTLTAVIITPDSRVALLRGRDRESVDTVEEGGLYKGWLVKKVTDIAVVLQQENQEQIIILERYAREFEQRMNSQDKRVSQEGSAVRLTPSRFNVKTTDNTDDLLSKTPMELLQRAMEQSQKQE